MPKNSTQTKRTKKTKGRSVIKRGSSSSRSSSRRTAPTRLRQSATSKNRYVIENGEPIYVMVPVDEYEKLIKADMVKHAVMQIDSKEDDFVDANDVALQIAGDRISRARKNAGLTQLQLAKKLRIPQSQISRIERNPNHTTIRTLKRVAKALNVDVRSLV